MDIDEGLFKFLDQLQLITAKPVIYVCNVDESVIHGNIHVDNVKELVANENAEILVLGAGIESDIAELDDFEEKCS